MNKIFKTALRNMASSSQVNFKDVKAALNDKNKLVIDVREPIELKETGELKGSVNIPLGIIENVFKNFTTEQFESVYGRHKPDITSDIIVSCRSGKRSQNSQMILQQLGYKNVYNYAGGWLDWEQQSKEEK